MAATAPPTAGGPARTPTGDPFLLTPGPLTTSVITKQAMVHDWGSRDPAFIALNRRIRDRLVRLVDGDGTHTAVLLQGSGTFAVEATVGTLVPRNGTRDKAQDTRPGPATPDLRPHRRVAVGGRVFRQGARRVQRRVRPPHCADAQVPRPRPRRDRPGRKVRPPRRADGYVLLAGADPQISSRTPWRARSSARPTPAMVEEALAKDPAVTHVCVIHCETTTGILNPIEEVRLAEQRPALRGAPLRLTHGRHRPGRPRGTHQIGAVVQRHGRRYLVDAMSSFGALPISAKAMHFDAVVSSANKCIEGVPGVAFAIVRTAALEEAAGNAHSLVLDLHDQWRYTEATG